MRCDEHIVAEFKDVGADSHLSFGAPPPSGGLRSSTLHLAAAGVLLFTPMCSPAQQVGDTTFRPSLETPTFVLGKGPVVMVDGGHRNFHTADGRFRPFVDLVRLDGFRPVSLEETLTREALAEARILVIANPLAEGDDWNLPNPSAYTDAEIEAVRVWVAEGGGLLLIADHMPFPGSAGQMARAFGVRFTNGFAFPVAGRSVPGPLIFRRSDQTLLEHPVTTGRTPAERVDSVATFTGQAFQAVNPKVRPLLRLPEGAFALYPDSAWRFHDDTPRTDVSGWLQGAARLYGEGRVVFMGEAASFTAQRAGEQQRPVGMNHPAAGGNSLFVLNVVRWLADVY